MAPIPLHLDIETSDPDDVLALCLLATHPLAALQSVTITPGGLDQVGVVKHVLARLGQDHVKVGAAGLDDGKKRVSGFHYRWLGPVEPAEPDGSVVEVIGETLRAGRPGLVTGAPLKNVLAAYEAMPFPAPWFLTWTCQGGFAGDDCVPPADRLEKFEGRTTCPTFNLNGDPRAAEKLLCHNPRTHWTYMVSKNVCHGLFLGRDDLDRIPRGAHAGLDMLIEGMGVYCKKKPEGKAVHDVLAAILALRTPVARWLRGEPYRTKGEWGFKPWEEPPPWDCEFRDYETQTWITVGVDRDAFFDALSH